MEKELCGDYLVCHYNGAIAICVNKDRSCTNFDVEAVRQAFVALYWPTRNDLPQVVMPKENQSLVRISVGDFLDYQGHCFMTQTPASRIYVPSGPPLRCSCLVERLENLAKHSWQNRLQSRNFFVTPYASWLSTDDDDGRKIVEGLPFEFVGIADFKEMADSVKEKFSSTRHQKARLAFWSPRQEPSTYKVNRFTFDLSGTGATIYDRESNKLATVNGAGADITAAQICETLNREHALAAHSTCQDHSCLRLKNYRPVQQGDVVDANALTLEKDRKAYCGSSCPKNENLKPYKGEPFIWYKTMVHGVYFFVPNHVQQ